jgi:hypothetical protein
MKMTKKTTFIAFLLLVTAFNTYSMEPETQQPQLLTWLRDEVTSSPAIGFTNLPKELKEIILGYLAMGTNATSVEEAGQAIKSLSHVNKELNQLINDPQFCLKLIKHLAKKFKCTDETAAIALNTKEAQRRLKIQREALQSINQIKYGYETELLPQEVDTNFTYGNSSTRVLLQYIFPEASPTAHDFSANNTNVIINLIERSNDVINMKYSPNPKGSKALDHFLSYISILPVIAPHILNNPEQKSYILKIIEALLNAGADLTYAKKEAKSTGDQDIINLINKAIKQKHSTKKQG